MNSRCDEIRDLIADAVTGVLPAEQAKRLDEHLAQCTDCRSYGEALQNEDLLLGRLTAGIAADMPARQERLVTALRRPSRRIRYPAGWRGILSSRVTRLTAAGLVLAAAIIVASHFHGTVVKAVELAEIAEALGEVPWMHASIVTEVPQATSTMELWIGFDAKVEGRKLSDGKVSFHRLREHQRADYDPNSRTITLSYAQEDDFLPQMSSPALIVESMRKALQDHGAEIVTRTGEHQGRKVQVQEVSLANHFRGVALCTVRLYVDPDSKLLYAMESKALDANDVAVETAQAAYGYPPTGPRDIYDLGVPREARIVNKMPANEAQRVLERYRQIRNDATKKYIAVIAHNTAVNITDAINMIDVDYKSDRKHRWERHSVFDEGQPFRDPQDPAWDISKQRIGETFESMLAWSQGQITGPGKTGIDIWLYEGEYTGSVHKDPRDGWGTSRVHYDPDGSGPTNALGDLAWPTISPDARMIEDTYAAEHKLICFERLTQGHIYNGTVTLPGRFLYYLDPAWDYLCRRQVIEWRPDADWQKDKDWLNGIDPNQARNGSIIVEEITEASQAPNGHWYPKSIIERQTGIRSDYRQAPLEDCWSKRVYLDLSPEFPEGIFDIDTLPGQ